METFHEMCILHKDWLDGKAQTQDGTCDMCESLDGENEN